MDNFLQKIILLICLPFLLAAGPQITGFVGVPTGGGAAPTCITLSGDLLQESFDGTGYDDADWDEDPANGPDEDSTDSLADSECFTTKHLETQNSSDSWARNDFGSSAAVYITLYFHISFESIPSGSDIKIFRLWNTSDGTEMWMELHDDSAALTVEIHENNEGRLGSAVSVSVDKQYKLKLYCSNGPDQQEWYLYDNNDVELGNSTGNTGSIASNLQKILLGTVSDDYGAVIRFDLVDIDSSGYA